MPEITTTYHTRLPKALFLELDKGATEPFSGRLRINEEENEEKNGKEEVKEIEEEEEEKKKKVKEKKEVTINVGSENFPILRSMIIDYDSIWKWLPKRDLNYYDLLVHDAVWTLYKNGIAVFSISTVIKVISGNPSLNPSKKQQEMVRDSISRLLSTSVKISFTQEYELYQKGNENSAQETIYEGQLVAGEIITDKINNRFSNAVIRLLREPILGYLASMKGQITPVSNIYLSVPVRLDEDTYKLRNYLLRRILRKEQRKEKKYQRSIMLKTLLDFMSIAEDEYMAKRRMLEKTKKMFSHWQKEEMISGYKIYSDKIVVYLRKNSPV